LPQAEIFQSKGFVRQGNAVSAERGGGRAAAEKFWGDIGLHALGKSFRDERPGEFGTALDKDFVDAAFAEATEQFRERNSLAGKAENFAAGTEIGCMALAVRNAAGE